MASDPDSFGEGRIISGDRSSIATRYAGAFFDLMNEKGCLEVAEGDVRSVLSMLKSSPDFDQFSKSPLYDRAAQQTVLTSIAEKAGLATESRNFLALIAANRRLFALPDILRAFLTRLSHHRGEVHAEAITATALSGDQERRLRSEIETMIGKAVNLTTRVDPTLLGGMIVKVGSRMIDSSLRTKLNRLKSIMKEA